MRTMAESTGYPGSILREKKSGFAGVLFLLLCGAAAVLLACLLLNTGLFDDLQSAPPIQEKPPILQEAPPADETIQAIEMPEETLPTAAPPVLNRTILVNADHPLPADAFLPEMIVLNDLKTDLFTVKEPNTLAAREVAQALTAMLTAAHQDGLTVWQVSEGYRSAEQQQQIWNSTYEKYRTVNGLSEKKARQATERRVASPGTSEHETGLALDLTVPGQSFRLTPQCQWLSQHCHEYGFIIRYTEEKERITGITAEPWHIRYVGTDAAERMYEENLCLEEYKDKYKD